MTKPVQRAAPAVALQRLFELTGKVDLRMDEVVVPVATVQELPDSPFQDTKPGGHAVGDAAAGVGRFSSVGIRAAEGVILRLEELYLVNQAAAVATYELFLVASDTIDLLANLEEFAIISTNTPIPAGTTGGARLASTVFRGDEANTVGSIVGRWEVPQESTMEVDLGKGGYLYGRQNNRPGYILFRDTDNAALSATFIATEYSGRTRV